MGKLFACVIYLFLDKAKIFCSFVKDEEDAMPFTITIHRTKWKKEFQCACLLCKHHHHPVVKKRAIIIIILFLFLCMIIYMYEHLLSLFLDPITTSFLPSTGKNRPSFFAKPFGFSFFRLFQSIRLVCSVVRSPSVHLSFFPSSPNPNFVSNFFFLHFIH